MGGQHQENAKFREYLLENLEPVDHYTDFVFENQFLNRLLINANKLSQYLYNNYINSSFQSKDTVIRRKLYHELTASRKISLIECGLSRQEAPRSEPSRVELSLPRRENVAYYALTFLQILVSLHYSSSVYILLNSQNKKLAISCSKTLQNVQTLVKIQDEPVRISKSAYTNQSDCFAHLESYLLERYDRFYFWNMSSLLDPSSPFYTLVNEHLLMETDPTLQMLHDEVSIVCYTLSLVFIFFVFVSSFVAEFAPYDIAPFVFLFDPHYTAHYVKSRVHHYQKLIEESYNNHWSIYEIKHQRAPTITLVKSQDCSSRGTRWRANCAPAAVISYSKLLVTPTKQEYLCDFKSYIPSARSPELRKVLMVAMPVLEILITWSCTCAFLAVYLVVTGENYNATELNNELKEFLSTGREPAGFNRTIATYCWPSPDAGHASFEQTKAQLGRLVRRNIINHLGATLGELYNSSEFVFEDDFDSDNNPLKWLIVNSLYPNKSLRLICWWFPFVGAYLISLIVALYFTNFLGVIYDLCFWLFEIRMKLDICKILLKFYNESNGNELRIVMMKGGKRSYARRNRIKKLRGDNRVDYCNLGTWRIISYIISRSQSREKMCHSFARKIYALDEARGHFHSDSFFLSAYLDFRLFIEQIDMCRNSINFLISFAVLHALNLMAASQFTDQFRSRAGFLGAGYFLANSMLLGASFFQSQCVKLITPIHSMLALGCNRQDKTIRHLSLLWRRALCDLVGERTKFSFRIYTIAITYALALEFNLAVTSLYILTLDKMHSFRS